MPLKPSVSSAMDTKEGFAERRRRQKEKLSLQRAERRMAASTPIEPVSTKISSPSEMFTADSPDSSENTDDAFVHVNKADAAEADVTSAQPSQTAGSFSRAVKPAVESSPSTTPASSPVRGKAQQPVGFTSVASPTSETAEAMSKLQVDSPAATKKLQAQVGAASNNASGAPTTPTQQATLQGPTKEQSAAQSAQHRPRAGGQSPHPGGEVTQRLEPASSAVSEGPESNARSPEQKQQIHGARPDASHPSASVGSQSCHDTWHKTIRASLSCALCTL